MAEQIEHDWNEVDVDENVTEDMQNAAETLSMSTPVGLFLVTVKESRAIEKNFDAYSCMAAKLKMQIDDVLKLEQVVLIDGKPSIIKGKEQKAVLSIPDSKKAAINKLYVGKFIFDEVSLFNPKEKEIVHDHRIYVAKRLGLITQNNDKLTGQHWGVMVIGNQVVIKTVWNRWEDQKTKEMRENVKVDFFSGYDYAANAVKSDEKKFAGII